jgi:hypothetical protein
MNDCSDQAKPKKPRQSTGACLCGALKFAVKGLLRDILVCHCKQCHRAHGQAAYYTQAIINNIHIESAATLRWYRSSASAQRGFCASCGSSLFWWPDGHNAWSIAAGALDDATGLAVSAHIFCAGRPDYDSIDENAQCFVESANNSLD